VHFVNDLAFEFQSGPFRVAPWEFRWIDDAGGTVRSIGLKARRRIWIRIFGAIDLKPVASTSASAGCTREIAAWLGCERARCWRAVCSGFQNNIRFPRLWHPHTKKRLLFTAQFGADLIARL